MTSLRGPNNTPIEGQGDCSIGAKKQNPSYLIGPIASESAVHRPIQILPLEADVLK